MYDNKQYPFYEYDTNICRCDDRQLKRDVEELKFEVKILHTKVAKNTEKIDKIETKDVVIPLI